MNQRTYLLGLALLLGGALLSCESGLEYRTEDDGLSASTGLSAVVDTGPSDCSPLCSVLNDAIDDFIDHSHWYCHTLGMNALDRYYEGRYHYDYNMQNTGADAIALLYSVDIYFGVDATLYMDYIVGHEERHMQVFDNSHGPPNMPDLWGNYCAGLSPTPPEGYTSNRGLAYLVGRHPTTKR